MGVLLHTCTSLPPYTCYIIIYVPLSFSLYTHPLYIHIFLCFCICTHPYIHIHIHMHMHMLHVTCAGVHAQLMELVYRQILGLQINVIHKHFSHFVIVHLFMPMASWCTHSYNVWCGMSQALGYKWNRGLNVQPHITQYQLESVLSSIYAICGQDTRRLIEFRGQCIPTL